MLAKVTLVHSFNSTVVENTFGRELPDGTDLQAEAVAVATLFGASDWLAGRSADILLQRVLVADDTPGTAATGDAVLSPPLAGDDLFNAAPGLCALVIQWKSAAKGKGGRGRMFTTGWPSSTAIAGFWTADAQTPASAAASVIFDAYGPGGDASLVIINRSAGGTPLSPHTAQPITAFTLDNVIRRIGRRERGRGI